MASFKMQHIGSLIRTIRNKKGYSLRKVAAFLDIDKAVLSKMERGQRKFKKEQVIKLASFFKHDEKEWLVAFFSDQILYAIGDSIHAKDALKVAEEKIEYKAFKALNRNQIIEQIKNNLKQF